MGFEKFTRRLALRGKTFIRANSASNQFAGSTTVASGDQTIVISTSVVKSDSLIFATYQSEVTLVASAQFFMVSSQADSAFFAFRFLEAVKSGPGKLYWEIRQP